ncbi:SRPBCC domain-containing protein [Chitinophaga sp. Hz27]|uniref:SRPBCC family protein n=1 Tax=Chitinophaga sp. Hz27 TaxID=3347169 RepID=UPI0035E19EA3
MNTTPVMTTTPLVVERVYNAPIESVWDALTNNEKLKQWYISMPEFKAVQGFTFSFPCTDHGEEFVNLCEVTEVIPGHKLAYSWRHEGHEGESNVSFELYAEGSKTRLVLTHVGLESFAGDIFPRSGFEKGWDYFINETLPQFLGA